MKLLLERLAELEHDRWLEWTKTLAQDANAINPQVKESWRKLWVPYNALPEDEKERFRGWARRVVEIFEVQLASERGIRIDETD